MGDAQKLLTGAAGCLLCIVLIVLGVNIYSSTALMPEEQVNGNDKWQNSVTVIPTQAPVTVAPTKAPTTVAPTQTPIESNPVVVTEDDLSILKGIAIFFVSFIATVALIHVIYNKYQEYLVRKVEREHELENMDMRSYAEIELDNLKKKYDNMG